ncbi:MAG: hypothetical protein SFX72_14445 [Isosphaeraceae bacterium]|nr:hypothetical protein [Isosphaeraceae bacterium]
MSRQLRSCLVLSIAAIATAACDSGGPSPVAAGMKSGPHGGVAVPLADGKAYVEVLVEKGGGTKTKPQVRLVAFFLTPELDAALAEAPSSISMKVIPPVGEPSTVTLKLQADAKDPLAKQKYVSDPGPYDYDELRGEITASVSGESSTAAFAFR